MLLYDGPHWWWSRYENKILDQYHQQVLYRSSLSKSLELTASSKNIYNKLPGYLIADISTDKKKILSNLRCNTSKLNGSLNKKFNASPNCPYCGSEESLTHFMLHCNKYAADRAELFNNIKTQIPHFCNLNDDCQLKILLNCHPKSNSFTCTLNFIYKSYKFRCSL